MNKYYRIGATAAQDAAMTTMAERLDISGQRGSRRSAMYQHLGDIFDSAAIETAWLLEIAAQVAAGGDLAELIELTPLPEYEGEGGGG
jgi:hypothetical protein